jgi:hypothetical protein
MNKGWKILKWVVLGFLFVVVFGGITMLLWNWLVPALFNGPVITFWQALGLLLLSKILFGFGGKHHHSNGKNHWKYRYAQKLSGMSVEDRERFKARMREKWCHRDKNNPGANSGSTNV